MTYADLSETLFLWENTAFAGQCGHPLRFIYPERIGATVEPVAIGQKPKLLNKLAQATTGYSQQHCSHNPAMRASESRAA
jgi:hypothetical protein